jgi:hypothetical protein
MGPTLCPILHRHDCLRTPLHQSRSTRALRAHRHSWRRQFWADTARQLLFQYERTQGRGPALEVNLVGFEIEHFALDLKLSLCDAGTSYTSSLLTHVLTFVPRNNPGSGAP